MNMRASEQVKIIRIYLLCLLVIGGGWVTMANEKYCYYYIIKRLLKKDVRVYSYFEIPVDIRSLIVFLTSCNENIKNTEEKLSYQQ